MGAEGARIKYPYLSGQRTEKASADSYVGELQSNQSDEILWSFYLLI